MSRKVLFGIQRMFTFFYFVDRLENTKTVIMKISKFLPMLLFLGVLAFSSCNDDDEEEEPAPTRSELLVNKNWSVTGLTVEPAIDIDNNGTQENNLIPFLAPCFLDDFFRYNSNGTYTGEEGASKCDPNDPQVFESGTWLWNSDQTRLVMNFSGGSRDVLVTSITAGELKYNDVIVDNNVTYTFSYTLNP
jgi:hypothetical protein